VCERLCEKSVPSDKKPGEATAARLHALEIAQKMIAEAAKSGLKKELLVIAALDASFLPAAIGTHSRN